MQNHKKQKPRIKGFPSKDANPIPYDEYDGCEDWEVDHDLLQKEDYPGLLCYRKQRAVRYPDDPYAQYYLGEAYVLNKEYDKAIQFLSEPHRENPSFPEYQHVILDALFALGKNEDDFDWVERPIILRMGPNIIEKCYEFLKLKRKPFTIGDLYNMFLGDYLLFTEQDLLKALDNDERFVVNKDDTLFIFSEVRVLRKKI